MSGVLIYGDSNIGRKRSSNQDSIFFDNSTKIMMVADGMGGHNGGDIASQLAVAILTDFIAKNLSVIEQPKVFIKEAIVSINDAIYKKSVFSPELQGMGTTINLAMFKGQSMYLGNIGDSRAYLINNKKLYQLSKDHSLVQEKINMGIYTREQACKDLQKNILVRAVGFADELDIDVFGYNVSKGDIFLSCSDGLHGLVNDHDILATINKYISNTENITEETLKETVNSLIELAIANGGNDNISVIIAIAL